jgi:hypothetical protein
MATSAGSGNATGLAISGAVRRSAGRACWFAPWPAPGRPGLELVCCRVRSRVRSLVRGLVRGFDQRDQQLTELLEWHADRRAILAGVRLRHAIRWLRALDPAEAIRWLRALDPAGAIRWLRALDPAGAIRWLRALDPAGAIRWLRALDSSGAAVPAHEHGHRPVSASIKGSCPTCRCAELRDVARPSIARHREPRRRDLDRDSSRNMVVPVDARE